MPPKHKKQKELVQDERFQAIVLTDSFESRFMPLTAVKPRCLLPLANVPLIEYTLEFLARAGVNEVYLMCLSHADQIQAYIEKLKWHKNPVFTVTTVLSLESRSVGDAMRDLDNRGLITGDFLLVSGDVVTNIDFAKVLAFHKNKKAQDKDHIVTMVLTPASPLHRSRSQLDPAVFVLDKKSSRCHYYQGIPPAEKRSSINIDPELLEEIDEFVVRNDLIDCHVDMCLPHVPQIFQENFDYQTLRGDFVRGVLTSDLVKKTFYAYITEDAEYASRVELWTTYDAILQDALARWCYPLTPDCNMLGDTSYTYESGNVYKEDKVVLAQSCHIGNNTCIGSNTTVGNSSAISKSVVGRNCTIGANVNISNAYIWDNTVIEDNVQIDHAIVAASARIMQGASVAPGSVVGFGVVVGRNQHIASGTRIVETPVQNEDSGFDSDDSGASAVPVAHVNDVDLVGEDGTGVLYVSDRDLDDESGLECNSVHVVYQMGMLNVSDESIASLSKRKMRRHSRHNSRSSRRLSSTLMVSDYDNVFSDEEEDFSKEAIATVERAMENSHDMDTALLELNTLRMSMNVTYHEVRRATVAALVRRVVHFVSTDTLNAKEAAAKVFSEWGALFKRQVFNESEQVDLAQILQEECSGLDAEYCQIILFVALRQLYEKDIVEEDSILEWWDSEASSQSEKLVAVRELTGQFVNWLRDAEEESDEE